MIWEQRDGCDTYAAMDEVLRLETSFALGFLKPSSAIQFGSSVTSYGTPGAGGSFGYADPDLELGFGYGMNRMDFYLIDDPRQTALRDAAAACARSVG